MLTYWKINFDRNCCINSTKYSTKFAKIMALYFAIISQSTCGWTFSVTIHHYIRAIKWSAIVKWSQVNAHVLETCGTVFYEIISVKFMLREGHSINRISHKVLMSICNSAEVCFKYQHTIIYFKVMNMKFLNEQVRPLFCFFWFFTYQSTIFQSCQDGSSWVEPVLSSR